MRMTTKFFGIAATLVALAVGAHAQTAAFIAAGSSALFLEAGQAAGTASAPTGPSGVGATCLWSQSGGLPTSLTVTDTATETGQAWIAWNPGTVGDNTTCGTINANTRVYVYVQTDSVLGNRLYFNGGKLGFVTTNPSGSLPSGLIFGASGEQSLNATVWNTVSGKSLTAAGTDIRPEDAKFATIRANQDCGVAVDSSQYFGLGYAFGTSIKSYYSSSTFNVVNFTLPASGYTAIPVGATPIIFAVNPSDASGFGVGVSDVDHTTLAKFLSGVFGTTNHLSGAAGAAPATVLIREPLSGTYNTTEYTSVNTASLQLSQDGGNCNGFVPTTNPLHIASPDNSASYRNRVIGTGEAIKYLLASVDAQGNPIKDQLGYAFWSTANWKNATPSTGRYLTVDGFDPLYDRTASNYSTTKNVIPSTASPYLPNVTFSDINNGLYPAWSALRLVTASSGANYNYANKLAQSLQTFISSTTLPDFIPFGSLTVWRSHFAPPSVSVTPNNGNVDSSNCGTEAGGDVGGAILAPPACTTGDRQ